MGASPSVPYQLVAMLLSLALTLAASAAPQEKAPPGDTGLRLDEALIATMPEGFGLEGTPIQLPDGKQHEPVHAIQWSPDGRQVAYVGVAKGKTHPIVGERVFDAYDYISSPVFGATGEQHLFRVGNRVSKTKEKWWVLIEGEEFGKQDWIGEVSFGPGGDCFAYWTQPGAKIARDGAYDRGDQVFLVAERKGKQWKTRKGQKWEDASSLTRPQFFADDTLIATTVQDDGQWHLLLVDRTTRAKKKYERTFGRFWGAWTALAMNAEGTSWAVTSYLFEFDEENPRSRPTARWNLSWDEKSVGASYEASGCAVYSPSEHTIAYKVLREGKMAIVVGEDESVSPEYDFVHSPVFRPDGEALAYVASQGVEPVASARMLPHAERMLEGGEHFVVSHATHGEREVQRGETWEAARDLVWDPKGEKLAYAAKSSAGWTVVVDGRRTAYFDEVGPPRFSADGALCAFGARTGRELWWKVHSPVDVEGEGEGAGGESGEL